MKRKLLFGMMLVLALILVGCGSKDEDSDERGLQNNGSATEDDSAKEPDKGNKPEKDKDKDHKDPIKDIVEQDKADPYAITVGGKQYELNAEEGIVGFGSMPGVGSLFRNGLEKTIHAYKLVNGIKTKEEYDSEEDILCSMYGNIYYYPAWLASSDRGSIKCDNGFILHGVDYSKSKLSFGYESHACMYNLLFLHDFEYMGVTQKSTAADMEKAGFYTSFQKSDYTNIISDDDYSYEDAKKEYDRLMEQEIKHAELAKSSLDDPVFPTQAGYMMALSMTGTDYLKFDMGFVKEAQEHYKPSGQTEDAYEKTRVLALWLGKKLMLLDEGKIDYIIVANAYPSDGEMNKENSAVLRLTLITRDDLMKKWPEKWGWKPQE